MLYTVVVILVILWALGLVVHIAGSFIHLLLVIAVNRSARQTSDGSPISLEHYAVLIGLRRSSSASWVLHRENQRKDCMSTLANPVSLEQTAGLPFNFAAWKFWKSDAGSRSGNDVAGAVLGKVPMVTLGFWIIKIIATTLGETGGDAVSMTINLGYAVASIIFIALFLVAVAIQIAAKKFHPFLYWAVIVATITAGTTMADFADRSLGIGYPGGSALLFAMLLLSLGVWYWATGSVSVSSIVSPKVEMFYWVTIMFSQTLGTALGDWMADTNGLGYENGAIVFTGGARRHRAALFLHQRLARPPVLERVHPHPAARRHAGRSARQADRPWRHGHQPDHRIRCAARHHARLHRALSAKGR